jgi:hypothetical protein
MKLATTAPAKIEAEIPIARPLVRSLAIKGSSTTVVTVPARTADIP